MVYFVFVNKATLNEVWFRIKNETLFSKAVISYCQRGGIKYIKCKYDERKTIEENGITNNERIYVEHCA